LETLLLIFDACVSGGCIGDAVTSAQEVEGAVLGFDILGRPSIDILTLGAKYDDGTLSAASLNSSYAYMKESILR
jgi:hypothetical protein